MEGGRTQSATCAILFTDVARMRAYTHLFRDEGTKTRRKVL